VTNDGPRTLQSHEPQETPTPRRRARSTTNGAIRGIHVLVVDDDTDLRDALRVALEAEQAFVVTVASVDEAISAIDRELPEVVVSDLGMPRRDGYDLIRTLRSRPPSEGGDVPAIALTAFSGGDVGRRSLEAGFQFCAQKPIGPDALVAAIATLAGRDT